MLRTLEAQNDRSPGIYRENPLPRTSKTCCAPRLRRLTDQHRWARARRLRSLTPITALPRPSSSISSDLCTYVHNPPCASPSFRAHFLPYQSQIAPRQPHWTFPLPPHMVTSCQELPQRELLAELLLSLASPTKQGTHPLFAAPAHPHPASGVTSRKTFRYLWHRPCFGTLRGVRSALPTPTPVDRT